MNRSLLASVALLVLVTLGVGCATTRPTATTRPRSFVLAVTVHGSLQPTPQQWAMIQARFARALAVKGWVLVNDVSLADHILCVDFTPDAEAPEDRGHAVILSVRRNPRSMVARRGTGPYSNGAFSYSSSFSSGWTSSSFYSNSYYGYGGFYDDGYFGGSGSYTPVILTPIPKTPPLRHHPGFRDDCPPGHSPGQFAGHTSDPTHERVRPPPSDYGRWSGEPTTARADRSYSRSSYSRSDSNYSRSDTYSPPSPSYSSYESSYSSPSHSDSASSVSNSASAAAAVASSAPPVEAVSAARD